MGLLWGFHGSKKIIITCLACSKQFKAGEGKLINVETARNIERQLTSSSSSAGSEIIVKDNKFWDVLTGLFILIIFIGIITFFAKTCNNNDKREVVTASTLVKQIAIDSNSTEGKFQLSLIEYEKQIMKINEETKSEMKSFEDKWMNMVITSRKSFEKDANTIIRLCEKTKLQIDSMPIPQVPKDLGGATMNSLVEYPKKFFSEAYLNYKFYYQNFKTSPNSDDREFWKKKAEKKYQKGLDEFADLKNTFQITEIVK